MTSTVRKLPYLFGLLFFFSLVVHASAETATRAISLNPDDIHKSGYSVPAGSLVNLLNHYNVPVNNTVIMNTDSGKQVVAIPLIPPGQSMGLEFSKKGAYSVCYSIQAVPEQAMQKCLRINVVALQAA